MQRTSLLSGLVSTTRIKVQALSFFSLAAWVWFLVGVLRIVFFKESEVS